MRESREYIVFSYEEIDFIVSIISKYWMKEDMRDLSRFIVGKFPVSYDKNGKRIKKQ